jgi:hypothetical protein
MLCNYHITAASHKLNHALTPPSTIVRVNTLAGYKAQSGSHSMSALSKTGLPLELYYKRYNHWNCVLIFRALWLCVVLLLFCIGSHSSPVTYSSLLFYYVIVGGEIFRISNLNEFYSPFVAILWSTEMSHWRVFPVSKFGQSQWQRRTKGVGGSKKSYFLRTSYMDALLLIK